MSKTIYSMTNWEYDFLNTTNEVLDLVESMQKIQTRWAFRGQPGEYGKLEPSLDRLFQKNIAEDRAVKIRFESQSVELFRRTLLANVSNSTERDLLNFIRTLALLQHYDGVTRLLDWSFSPFTALYFAVSKNDNQGGEIWAISYDQYGITAPNQWYKYPEMKHNDWSKAFDKNSSDDWFVCEHLLDGIFPRLYAQDGFFSMTSQFGRDHSKEIAKLFQIKDTYHLYIINKKCKFELRRYLAEKLHIWHGSIYPDITGAGAGIKEILQDQADLLGTRYKKSKRRKYDQYLRSNIRRFLRI